MRPQRALRPPVIAVAALLLLATACTRDERAVSSPLEGFNLIIVNIDSLRADHLGCYGYSRPTSPFIDRIASEGVLFENAMSNSSFTRESVATLFTGRLPSSAGAVGWEAAPLAPPPHLAALFRQAGYRSGFFSNSVMLGHPLFTREFDEVQHLPDRWGISGAGPRLSQRAAAFMEMNRGTPFLLYLHYLDPHGPYEPPEENYRRLADAPLADPVSLYSEVRPRFNELRDEGFGPGEARFEDLVLRYDAEISHTDESIGMLFSAMERLDLADRTLVVITADHGEEFLEHGFVEHAWTLYRESLHVPLILWAPQALTAGRVDALVSTVDLLPTVLELMEIPHDPRVLDGSPVLAWRDGGFVPASGDRRVIAELLIRERNRLRAVIEEDWKYIVASRWLPPAARPEAVKMEQRIREELAGVPAEPWGEIVHEEFYRLSEDPQETRDVADLFEEERRRLRAALEAYRERCERSAPAPRELVEESPLTPEQEKRLRALGYL